MVDASITEVEDTDADARKAIQSRAPYLMIVVHDAPGNQVKLEVICGNGVGPVTTAKILRWALEGMEAL